MGCSCGYTAGSKSTLIVKETVKKDPKAAVDVVDQDKGETLPLTDASCPKCGNDKAYYWLIQTRASDEPETKFLRCAACKHTWRDYS